MRLSSVWGAGVRLAGVAGLTVALLGFALGPVGAAAPPAAGDHAAAVASPDAHGAAGPQAAADAHGAAADAHGAAADAAHGDAAGSHGADAQGGGHGGGGLPQLNADTFPTQIFWLGVCFAVLYFLVAGVAMPRVIEVVETRESRIAHDIDRADELRADAEALAFQTDKVLAAARAAAQAAMAEALEEVEAFRRDRLLRLEKDMEARLAEAEGRIEAAKQEALVSLDGTAADLARDVALRVSGQDIAPDVASRAVHDVMGAVA